jgi:hypothetical protein
LRQKLLKDYEGKSQEVPMVQKMAELADDGAKLRQELLSSQMLNSAQENTIRQLKLQVKMKEHDSKLLQERQVRDCGIVGL